MRVLGIESSCDEMSAAVVEDGVKVISNVIYSQVSIHAQYGGVVPEVASRQHLLQVAPVIKQALTTAKITLGDIDAIAVTNGPGLAGSLLVGVGAAKAIAFATDKPLIGINHLEGHIYANWLEDPQRMSDNPFPLMCLIVSGGHTELISMTGHGQYEMLGQTRDDAAGEAFDKVASILGLGFPGGPAIDKISKGLVSTYKFPRAWLKGSYDFSFSGLKTSVLHASQTTPAESERPSMAAGFQEAVVDVLVSKAIDAATNTGSKQILIAGGVAANSLLSSEMRRRSPVPVMSPRISLCTDNAAMIACCAYFRLASPRRDNLAMDVSPSLTLA
ncbi:MAG: tRNA (adenosine(37)-N6)-threonylcarbamoyltransferase complex transferase subunit TsaD [Dehalococcoidia bacterium]|nr:tRNA (adenosine(37)-N6)-threonylcarbamoyltransferase complex transferase subunit TsaD [Dehalococcoidia bacterium]